VEQEAVSHPSKCPGTGEGLEVRVENDLQGTLYKTSPDAHGITPRASGLPTQRSTQQGVRVARRGMLAHGAGSPPSSARSGSPINLIVPAFLRARDFDDSFPLEKLLDDRLYLLGRERILAKGDIAVVVS
jgi:hypothetical protein